jgi:hypothetical protein
VLTLFERQGGASLPFGRLRAGPELYEREIEARVAEFETFTWSRSSRET